MGRYKGVWGVLRGFDANSCGSGIEPGKEGPHQSHHLMERLSRSALFLEPDPRSSRFAEKRPLLYIGVPGFMSCRGLLRDTAASGV